MLCLVSDCERRDCSEYQESDAYSVWEGTVKVPVGLINSDKTVLLPFLWAYSFKIYCVN